MRPCKDSLHSQTHCASNMLEYEGPKYVWGQQNRVLNCDTGWLLFFRGDDLRSMYSRTWHSEVPPSLRVASYVPGAFQPLAVYTRPVIILNKKADLFGPASLFIFSGDSFYIPETPNKEACFCGLALISNSRPFAKTPTDHIFVVV